MDLEERITRLREYRKAAIAWEDSDDRQEQAELRSFMNQNKRNVVRDVLEAGCHRTLTIGPPPAIGGLVMRGVDPFDMMFDPPYMQSLTPHVIDMLDETIGVLGSAEFQERSQERIPQVVNENVRAGFVFVAMPIDSNDHELEDVLDSIKEACGRCGLTAERVDEPHTNERITDRILESIRVAQYVVVDLTKSKPNVFYEAGYAQGQGKTPIYVARDGTLLEFDLKDYPVIFFKNMKQLKEKLENRLRGLAARNDEP